MKKFIFILLLCEGCEMTPLFGQNVLSVMQNCDSIIKYNDSVKRFLEKEIIHIQGEKNTDEAIISELRKKSEEKDTVNARTLRIFQEEKKQDWIESRTFLAGFLGIIVVQFFIISLHR